MPTPSKHVKFVASDPSRGGLPVKRKQVQHACASCRKKKRRCVHAEDAVDETSPPVEEDETSRSTTALPDSSLQYANSTANASPAAPTPRRESGSTPNQSSRFVGDLNPEGMFMEATGSASIRETSQKGDVGIWLSSNNPGQASQFITSRPPPIMDQFLLPFVKEHCLSCLPPQQDYLKLKALYLEKIHPVMPIIPESALEGDEPASVVLKQLICLAASTDPSMALYLHLQNKGDDLLPCQDFMQSLSSAVRAILETSIITDRVLHIRALILLSLYTQPNSSEEADLPAQLGGRAIHHIQTLGLHLLRYDGPNSEELETLFCAVWAVDRINAAVLFLSVVQWLDQVIELYRPGPSAEASGLDKIAYIDLPVLEAMIVNADALKVPGSLIATIETFYHAVIILSCRLPRPGTLTAASTLPPPSANARRSLAAERIACAVLRDHLSPMPFVPYAVCLALSVEYRKMRHSRLPMFRSRAMHAFRRNCEMLRRFGDYFWSANVVAGLGERVLKEMERAANTLTRESPPPAPAVVNTVAVTNPSMVNAVPSVEQAVDFSLIDAISGADVFGAIDPSFNLGAVEDALEANLDIGLPMNWVDWGQYATLS
ncbi:transcription factor [Fusarium tjaetaba]|uniref:Transcription factor n=1 Tax=Fusarium tjaetaba TaxID=1567544 RepID=A0A8H5VML2_9HYPO|nr:transcription factor [Fusarium tjaetaba]KAF5627890.1 transcription factor [Fusarium tjaetaba]